MDCVSPSNMFRYSFLVFALPCVSVTGTGIDEFMKLAYSASKAAYIQFHIVRRFASGQIMEKNGRGGYIPACNVRGWNTKGYEIRDTELLLFQNHHQKLAVFAFRGTEPTINDWRKNFKIWLTNVYLPRCKTFKLHKGFHDRFMDIWKWFEAKYRAIPRDYKIVITGHSLGGAMGTISAAYAGSKLGRRPDALITFASPKVGDKTFQNCYQVVVGCDRTLRITTSYDIVTAVPFFSYTHVCHSLVIDYFTLDLRFNHGLYQGYERGLQKKYGRNMTPVNFGCDREI